MEEIQANEIDEALSRILQPTFAEYKISWNNECFSDVVDCIAGKITMSAKVMPSQLKIIDDTMQFLGEQNSSPEMKDKSLSDSIVAYGKLARCELDELHKSRIDCAEIQYESKLDAIEFTKTTLDIIDSEKESKMTQMYDIAFENIRQQIKALDEQRINNATESLFKYSQGKVQDAFGTNMGLISHYTDIEIAGQSRLRERIAEMKREHRETSDRLIKLRLETLRDGYVGLIGHVQSLCKVASNRNEKACRHFDSGFRGSISIWQDEIQCAVAEHVRHFPSRLLDMKIAAERRDEEGIVSALSNIDQRLQRDQSLHDVWARKKLQLLEEIIRWQNDTCSTYSSRLLSFQEKFDEIIDGLHMELEHVAKCTSELQLIRNMQRSHKMAHVMHKRRNQRRVIFHDARRRWFDILVQANVQTSPRLEAIAESSPKIEAGDKLVAESTSSSTLGASNKPKVRRVMKRTANARLPPTSSTPSKSSNIQTMPAPILDLSSSLSPSNATEQLLSNSNTGKGSIQSESLKHSQSVNSSPEVARRPNIPQPLSLQPSPSFKFTPGKRLLLQCKENDMDNEEIVSVLNAALDSILSLTQLPQSIEDETVDNLNNNEHVISPEAISAFKNVSKKLDRYRVVYSKELRTRGQLSHSRVYQQQHRLSLLSQASSASSSLTTWSHSMEHHSLMHKQQTPHTMQGLIEFGEQDDDDDDDETRSTDTHATQTSSQVVQFQPPFYSKTLTANVHANSHHHHQKHQTLPNHFTMSHHANTGDGV